jgi:hydrogenase maturation protease
MVAAEKLGTLLPEEIRVVKSSETGFYLLDYILDCSQLVVVDSIVTKTAPVGTVHMFKETDIEVPQGSSQHYIGLFEVLKTGRQMRLPVPDKVVIVAVEVGDCLTIGGAMSPEVSSAIPDVLRKVTDALGLRST